LLCETVVCREEKQTANISNEKNHKIVFISNSPQKTHYKTNTTANPSPFLGEFHSMIACKHIKEFPDAG
jgi:hypothetical protein